MQKEPQDACARGFFMPESQGMSLNLGFERSLIQCIIRCSMQK